MEAGRQDIESLEGAEDLRDLRVLQVPGSQVQDLGPLFGLRWLVELACRTWDP